ncbi:hypothetical protein L596_009076 [Steinernema carpocapsae]|uniref:Calponin-homology (CH) domain-containing protein n=1 Tax=Steinernema carpocapsae TaxID=34508 RepID=A0A4U5PF53_STECR|nr:hypothetical protein L596_009076 [Steinernema carpocapsae]
MSTEAAATVEAATVESPKEEVAPAVPETAPPAEIEAPKEAAAPAAEGEATEEKTEEEPATAEQDEKKEEEKQPEPPKDPKEDPVGWVNSLIAPAVHKVNHEVLSWAQQLAVEDEEKRQPLPGKNGFVTKNQFLSFLRDGSILAQLANKLQVGAVETVHEGEAAQVKENQSANIEGFVNFAKEKAGLADDQVFSAEDLLEKGKAAYPAVFGALVRLGMASQEKFEQKGLDVDAIAEMASQVVKTSIIQTILNFFRRASARATSRATAAKSEKAAAASEEKASDIEKKPLEEVAEEECKKVEAAPEAAAPVAVN